LVVEGEFTTWTADNLLRQAAFKGVQEDKPARELMLEGF
jgi:bifunctional non-homologous end joining protein LigD